MPMDARERGVEGGLAKGDFGEIVRGEPALFSWAKRRRDMATRLDTRSHVSAAMLLSCDSSRAGKLLSHMTQHVLVENKKRKRTLHIVRLHKFSLFCVTFSAQSARPPTTTSILLRPPLTTTASFSAQSGETLRKPCPRI